MSNYIPIINLLRGIAAIMVCFYHFVAFEDHWGSLFTKNDFMYKAAEFGVQGIFIFFVVSGVVIPISLLNSNFHIRGIHRFLWRRWIRIELPYLGSIALILLVAFLFSIKNGESFQLEPVRLIHHATYTIPWTEYDWYNVIYWTLAIEFQFYILIGIIFPLIRAANKWYSYLVIIGMNALPFLSSDHRLITFYAPIFAVGIFVFLKKTKRITNPELLLMTFCSLPIIVIFHDWIIMGFVIMTALVILFIDNDINDLGLGKISYSLYLIHGVIGGSFIYFVGRYATTMPLKIIIVLLAIIFSLVCSWIYWKLIEDPSRKLSKRIKLE